MKLKKGAWIFTLTKKLPNLIIPKDHIENPLAEQDIQVQEEDDEESDEDVTPMFECVISTFYIIFESIIVTMLFMFCLFCISYLTCVVWFTLGRWMF